MKKNIPSPEALRRCYPPVPETYRAGLARSLDALPAHRPTPRRRWAAALVFALCLLLMTAAVAAIASGVLAYLSFDHPSALDESLQPSSVAAQCSLEGVTLRVRDAVSDGCRLSFSLEAQSTSPDQLYLLEPYTCTVNGVEFGSDYEVLCEGWLPGFFSGDAQGGMTLRGGVLGQLRQAEACEALEVVMTYTLSKPARPVAIVDERLYDSSALAEAYGEDAQNLYACAERLRGTPRVTIAEEGQLDPAWWVERGYTVLDLSGELTGVPDDTFSGPFFHPVRDGQQMEQIGLMELRFSVPVETGRAYSLTAVPAELDDGGVLAFDRLVYTPLTFQARCVLTLPAHSQEEALAYCASHGLDRFPVFADEQGREILFPDAYGGMDSSGPYPAEDGRWLMEWRWDLIPPRELPSRLHLLCAGEAGNAALTREIFEKAMLLCGKGDVGALPQRPPSRNMRLSIVRRPVDFFLNCTPFVRQYDILCNKWGVKLCQKGYQTRGIRQNSRKGS